MKKNSVFCIENAGTRIWDHAKMRGRGASKTGLRRKPGPWWSGENFSRVPMFPGVVTPFPWPLLVFFKILIESRAQFRKLRSENYSSKKRLSSMKRSKRERRES